LPSTQWTRSMPCKLRQTFAHVRERANKSVSLESSAFGNGSGVAGLGLGPSDRDSNRTQGKEATGHSFSLEAINLVDCRERRGSDTRPGRAR
jgi:hypothetical protein